MRVFYPQTQIVPFIKFLNYAKFPLPVFSNNNMSLRPGSELPRQEKKSLSFTSFIGSMF